MNHEGDQMGKSMSRNERFELKAPDNNLQNNKDVDCQKYGTFGNHQSQCTTPRRENGDVTIVSVAFNESDSVDTIICLMESKLKTWMLDLGASFYVNSSKELLKNYV